MVFTLRRGQEPDAAEYRHFLKPPKLEELRSAERGRWPRQLTPSRRGPSPFWTRTAR